MATYRFSEKFIITFPEFDSIKLINTQDETKVTLGVDFLGLIKDLRCNASFTKSEFCASACSELNCNSEQASSIFDKFCLFKFVIPENHKFDGDDLLNFKDETLSWDINGWGTAKIFHEGVVFSNFFQGTREGWEDTKAVSELLSQQNNPPIVKEYTTPVHNLVEPEEISADLFESLLNRRTSRDLQSSRPFDLNSLSTILHYTARTQSVIQDGLFGEHVLKTTPSGGARHPIEVYPVILKDIEDLSSGIYYYNHLQHGLQRISDSSKNLIENISQHQIKPGNNSISFILTARFDRNLWKYNYSKSYTFTHLDAAHLMQNILLVAEAMNIKSFITPALNVEKTAKELGFKNVFDECPVYFVALAFK